jgi:hypothetical protein
MGRAPLRVARDVGSIDGGQQLDSNGTLRARRAPDEKLRPMPNIYLYPELRERFPGLPLQAVATLENTVKAKYRAKRYETIWTSKASLPVYRYPAPFPVPNQGWSITLEEDRPVVSVRLGTKRVDLRLKGGPRFRHQLVALRAIESRAAVQGQLDLYRRGEDVLCKIIAWLPRDSTPKERSGTLFVRTAPDAMIVALDTKGEKLWHYHGDQIPRWSAEHSRQLKRWADDSKAEHRPCVPFAQRREESVRRYRNRVDSACHQIAAVVAGYAQRRRCAAVEYRDTDHSFCPQFPWFRLRQLIAEKCDNVEVRFEYSIDGAIPESLDQLAEK